MNITKDLHSAMLDMGFVFEPIELNQTEPTFLIAKIYFMALESEFLVRVPNNKDAEMSDILDRLVQSVHKSGYTDGVSAGKREVGNYLKSLTN